MRLDPPGTQLLARDREPRHVVGIIYDTGSLYLTSREGIANVPGTVVQGCVQNIEASSQQLFPDEGRATIGSLSFTAVDLSGAITEAIRDQLLNLDRGIRNCEVRVFTGDGDDFNRYVRIDTYVIDEAVELDQGLYSFSCSDRNRELREEVFQQVGTRLTSTLDTGDTTVNVQNTAGFSALKHTAAFEDAPGATVGYIRIRKTGEIIRWTGKTASSFTGCTRECFHTIADKVEVDPATDADKLPEVEEFIYLQMPGPQLAYAVMTGHILGTTDMLPDLWHLGMDEANVDKPAFENIGADLYDPTDPAAGFVLSFAYLQQTDGKQFFEQQINRVLLTFCPVDSLGRVTIKRMAALLSTAAPSATIDYDNVISHSPIRHLQSKVINEIVFDWNYDGKEYTRTDVLVNGNSISTYGRGTRLSMELGGLSASQHGRASLQHIMDSYTDRYGAPPIMVTVEVSAALNNIEIGDCVRLKLDLLPDFSGAGTLDRAFEVQSRSWSPVTGALTLDLFASTSRVDPDNHGGTDPYLPNSWYTSEGTALSSVLTMTGDHVVASGALAGNADLRLAVYYHDGDVIIDSGVTVTITDNVQIRCTGELHVIGKINGAGQGIPARVEPNVVGAAYVSAVGGPVQTLGSTQGSAGIWHNGSEFLEFGSVTYFGPAAIARAALRVAGTTLVGIPAELRGTPGVPAVGVLDTGSLTVRALGGIGGAGGAGLMIACRGLSFGVAGEIDLSGQSGGSALSGPITIAGTSLIGGAGGGGCAGTLLVVLDGDQITFPALPGAFVANHGATPQAGTPIARAPPDSGPQPWTGRSPGIGFADNAEACSIVQYLTLDSEYGNTDDEVLPPPTDLVAIGDGSGVTLTWNPPAPDKYDYVEVWEAISNDRTGALRVAQVRGDHYSKTSGTSITRYYWVRAVKTIFGQSAWEPANALDGVSATFGGATGSDTVFYYIKPTNGTALHNSASTLTVEAHKLTGGVDLLLSTGTIKLYVGATEVSFANGYGVGSDGYTGVFDSGDIGGDVVVELKDGPSGDVLDTITLVDVLDGTASADATYGYIEPEGPLAWTRASDQVTWTPAATAVDMNCTFTRGGSDVARIARRITRDSSGGLTTSSTTHPGGDLNTGDVTISDIGLGGSQAVGVKFDYDDGAGHVASVSETAITSMAGADGADGISGADSAGLVTNPGFEVGSLLPGWATSGSQATPINDPAKAHSGSWSVHVGTGSTGIRTAPTYRPSMLVGQTIVATCWAARDASSLPDADGALSIQWEDSSGTVIGTSALALVDHTVAGYQALRAEGQVPNGATHAVIQFKKTGGSTGQWYVDDFLVYVASEGGQEIVENFGYVNLADFNNRWIERASTGEIAFLTGLTDAPSGTAVRLGNDAGNDQVWKSLNRLLAYDGKNPYEVGVIARRNYGSGLFYCGFEGVAADGVTLINRAGANDYGSQHYFAADGVAPGSTWTLYRGYSQGWGTPADSAFNDPSAPGVLKTGVAFVRPMFLVNYSGATGQMDIAAIWVRRLSGGLAAKGVFDWSWIDTSGVGVCNFC